MIPAFNIDKIGDFNSEEHQSVAKPKSKEKKLNVLIIEDIKRITDLIKLKFKKKHTLCVINSIDEFESNEEIDEIIKNTDLFFLDYSLGDRYGENIMESGIYREIISLRKKTSKIISISSYEIEYLTERFKEKSIIPKEDGLYFDCKLKKAHSPILNYIRKHEL